jgi:rRNA maturation endonuclease Nob1
VKQLGLYFVELVELFDYFVASNKKWKTPCGGCGATIEKERCIGCLHEG